MKTEKLDSWESFEERLSTFPLVADRPHGFNHPPLFRGQSSTEFKLDDTLFRRQARNTPIIEYYRILKHTQHPVESFTDQTWPVANWPDLADIFEDYDKGSLQLTLKGMPAYEFLLFVRHNGFPSPLLDWSRSPYVAAFFAFRRTRTEDVSIYVLTSKSMQIYSPVSSLVCRTGSLVTGHQRHFLQQSDYTICVRFHEDGFWQFVSPESHLNSDDCVTDSVTKFILPSTERNKVLKKLDRHNLNAYSLFNSPEAQMETLAFRLFEGSIPASHPNRPRLWNDL